MAKTIALYGGSFNPPGKHHEAVVRELAARFDQVIVIPCGPRPDKDTTNLTEPVHRATLVDLAFRDLPGLRVDLFDLEEASFTRTYDLDARYHAEGELWHAIGSDLIQGGAAGKSPIQEQWYRGPELWQRLNFVVFKRPGYDVVTADLPPHHVLIESSFDGSSSKTREAIYRRLPIDEFVTAEVRAHIDRYQLYRHALPQRATRLTFDELRPLLIIDEANPRARKLSRQIVPFAVGPDEPRQHANCYVVIGGDGMMLHAIREHWRWRLPMIGISAGHHGFLLNRAESVVTDDRIRHDYIVQHLPLLYVEAVGIDGVTTASFAFNDAWVERATSQTAWVEVRIDGQTRIQKLVCDGILTSTAAGSTAYARAMGATPLRVDTPELVLVGSNIMEPANWKVAHLSLDSAIEFHCLHPEKRPLRGFVDGVPQGEVRVLRVRKSRIAAVELAFTPERDLTAKLTEIQFPR